MNTYPVRDEPEIKAWVEQLEKELIEKIMGSDAPANFKPATVLDDAWTLGRQISRIYGCNVFDLKWTAHDAGWLCIFAIGSICHCGQSTSPALAICQALGEVLKEHS